MNLAKMIAKNRQVVKDWKLLFLDKFESNHLNRHAVRTLKYAIEGKTGGKKRDKKKIKIARAARRRNRKAKQ